MGGGRVTRPPPSSEERHITAGEDLDDHRGLEPLDDLTVCVRDLTKDHDQGGLRERPLVSEAEVVPESALAPGLQLQPTNLVGEDHGGVIATDIHSFHGILPGCTISLVLRPTQLRASVLVFCCVVNIFKRKSIRNRAKNMV